MNEFNPGDGWREMPYRGDQELPKDCVAYLQHEGGWRYWVRVPPVQPLPTEPYTVIRITWRKGGAAVLTLTRGGAWRGTELDYFAEDLSRAITGFEVLAEPRPVTAKAVLDRVRQEGLIQLALAANPRNGDAFDTIARDFGVAS